MRRASNAVPVLRDAPSPVAHDGPIKVCSSESDDDDLDAMVAAAVHDAKQLVDDLSHDLRQPLSSVSMNVQSAIRCLQQPQPRVALALQALRECQFLESELLALLTAVQHRLSNKLAESRWHLLDDGTADPGAEVIDEQGGAPRALAPRFMEDSRYARVTVSLRDALVAIARSILALARTNAGALRCDPSSVRIETRRVADRPQLRLSGIRFHSTDDIHFLRECVESAASHVQGKVLLELGPDASAIVISFPARTAARRPTLARGHHGT